MADIAALYLAHLNPMTKAHETIISTLKREYSAVYVFPVRFLKHDKEVNTRSFPFSYELRKAMVQSVFDNAVHILPDYTFQSPYSKYLPPLLSSKSWKLRNQIVSKVTERAFVSYTGDRAERLMLLAYGLHPLRRSRLDLSATAVREKLYAASENPTDKDWRESVPEKVADIIEKNWQVVKRFGAATDLTKRILGMKFPVDGYAKYE